MLNGKVYENEKSKTEMIINVRSLPSCNPPSHWVMELTGGAKPHRNKLLLYSSTMEETCEWGLKTI